MVMKGYVYLLTCIVAMFVVMPVAKAQRLIPRQKGIEIAAGIPIIKGNKLFSSNNYEVSILLSRYLKRENYTFMSIEYQTQDIPYRSYNVAMQDILANIGYMHPLFSDKGKNVLAYIGMSAVCGYEQMNNGEKILPDGATLLDRSRFVYGPAVHFNIECFLSDNIILLLKSKGIMLFGTDLHRLRPSLSAGLRITI